MKQLALWFIEPYEKNRKSNDAFNWFAIMSVVISKELAYILLAIIVFKILARVWQFGFSSITTTLQEDQY